MDEDEIESFVKIKEKLQKKCQELENDKAKLVSVVEEDSKSLEQIKQLNLQLKNEFNSLYATYNTIPKDLNKKEARILRAKVRQLSATYSQLQDDLIAQKDHNNMISENLDKSFTQSSQKSIQFVKQSLLYELHELTQENAPAETILKKEKQIQMCDLLY